MKLYKIIKMPPFFLKASFYMKKDDQPMVSSEKSRNPIIIPTLLMQYGSIKDKLKGWPIMGKAFKISFREMYKSATQIKQNPKIGKNQITPSTLEELEDYAKELGVSVIGYTKVKPEFIFKGFKVLYPNAMVLGMEMEREAMKTNPSDASTIEIWKAYSGLGIAVNKLAKFIRSKGFNCHPSPALGGDLMFVPLAQEAGIGVVGKNGLLITPELGPSLRLAAVFLDIDNLPIQTIETNPHLWVKEFYETCNHCVKSCPGNAIFEETKILEDGFPKFIDPEKCAPAFSKNCSICISSCPFIMGHYDAIKTTFDRHQKEEIAAT